MNYLEEKNVLIMLDLLNLHKHPPKKKFLIENHKTFSNNVIGLYI